MKARLIFAIGILVFLSFNPCNAQPTSTQVEKVTNYQIAYKDFPWYIRFVIWIKGLEFLDWKELIIKETILKNEEGGEEKIISVRITPKDHEDILYLKSNGDNIEGFMNFASSTTFKKEEVVKLVMAWNYLHTPEEGKTDVNIPDLFESTEGNLYCKLQ